MLGWMIIVSKESDDKAELVRWETSNPMVNWLTPLKAEGVIQMVYNGGGYPNKYIVKAGDLFPIILNDDVIFDENNFGHSRDIKRNAQAIEGCQPDEMLCVEMWDLS